jgi:hypothetical protein
MKKIFLFALAVAVVCSLPMTVQAGADFELGGYIRLDALWNSQTGMRHTLSAYPVRNNTLNGTHGMFNMNANATRLNLTMKGPEVWGGKVTGFIEFDFDGNNVAVQTRAAGGALSSFQLANSSDFIQAAPRLRHAMFKIVWPDREVLFGQYWSINSEMTPDTADSGGYCLYGATQLRVPQVRYTQKFMDGFDGSLELAYPASGRWGINVDLTNPLEGETSEMPMVEGKLRFEQDFYGKAGFAGRPRGFYVGAGAGYFRTRNVTTAFTAGNWQTLGKTGFFVPAVTMTVNNMRYHDHWLFIVDNFVPIIPTTTKSLAGTLSFTHQWWVGQGVSAWRLDMPGSDRFYRFDGLAGGTNNYDMSFIKRWGGWGQLQYYWTEQIYTNLNGGIEKAFNFGAGGNNFAALGFHNYANPIGYDPINSMWRVSVTQWYRPVAAIKFALQYSFTQANYFQVVTAPAAGQNSTRTGNNHGLFANAWYMF